MNPQWWYKYTRHTREERQKRRQQLAATRSDALIPFEPSFLKAYSTRLLLCWLAVPALCLLVEFIVAMESLKFLGQIYLVILPAAIFCAGLLSAKWLREHKRLMLIHHDVKAHKLLGDLD